MEEMGGGEKTKLLVMVVVGLRRRRDLNIRDKPSQGSSSETLTAFDLLYCEKERCGREPVEEEEARKPTLETKLRPRTAALRRRIHLPLLQEGEDQSLSRVCIYVVLGVIAAFVESNVDDR